MRVLIGIAYHKAKHYSLEHVLEWVANQTYKDCDIIMRFHTGPYGEPNAVKIQREFFRTVALEKGYDYLYQMGADTIPPLDVIERLMAHHKDVTGALYRYRSEDKPPVAWRTADFDKEFMKEGGLVEVDGMGNDAVLLSRAAFEGTSYLDWEQIDDDWPYYDRLRARGFPIYLDTETVCKHYIDNTNYA